MPVALDRAPTDDAVLSALRRFGHSAFLEGQREVVDDVLAGRDVVVVMPTGGGKSLCYQLPALLEPGPTVVVSPLIALMKDQVDALSARGIGAAALHSNLDTWVQREIEDDYRSGNLRLLYVAPERLVRSDLRSLLSERRPARIVVDEAHCISEWGHDFRRDYLRIGEIAGELAPLQLVACTATATPAVRADIVTRLGLRDPAIFVHGFARTNLHLSVRRVRSEAEKLALLDSIIDPADGHAIVYAGTRARAASVAERLRARHPTMLYHGELSAEERVRAHERFATGEVRVAVATSAFGMGIDVASVRQVVHVALPSSLEEYYQQAGRAGRDGHSASCVVIHAPADRRLPEFFIDAAHPDAATISSVLASLRTQGGDPGSWRQVHTRDARVASLSDAAGDAARELLREAGATYADGSVVTADAGRLAIDHGRIASHRRLAYQRFDGLLTYLRGGRCRHLLITDHFGETDVTGACRDRCDICAGSESAGGAQLDTVSVRQALSAVARLNGRVGLTRVAAVLAGSTRRGVGDAPGLTALPTYGALRGWRDADVCELLRSLVDAGAVRQSSPPYPTLALTELGVEAMRGDRTLRIGDPRRPATGIRSPRGQEEAPVLDGDDQNRLAALRAWRSDEARQRAVPAYIVFHDRTLVELARRNPDDEAALAAVPGVGPGKLALYGGALLSLLTGEQARLDATRGEAAAP
jgi:ATP-dependent DNA helicase RecQ